jgi:hypothetical protein
LNENKLEVLNSLAIFITQSHLGQSGKKALSIGADIGRGSTIQESWSIRSKILDGLNAIHASIIWDSRRVLLMEGSIARPHTFLL